MNRLIVAVMLVACAQGARAEEINIDLSSDSVRGVLSGPLSRIFSNVTGQYDAGVIYKQGEDNSADPKDTQLTLGHFGVLATGDVGAKNAEVAAGLGARAVFKHGGLKSRYGGEADRHHSERDQHLDQAEAPCVMTQVAHDQDTGF